MSEDRYRLFSLVLFGIFVAGTLCIGWQLSQNGRNAQRDVQKDYLVTGASAKSSGTQVVNTPTGAVRKAE